MAKHAFGLMQTPPKKGTRYDVYEPQKYNCITVFDKDLEIVAEKLGHIDFYWHTLDVKGKGLAYCGITLIPPSSLSAFAEAFQDIENLSRLKALTEEALCKNKWIIHFGL